MLLPRCVLFLCVCGFLVAGDGVVMKINSTRRRQKSVESVSVEDASEETALEKLTFLPSDLNTLEIIAERLEGVACKRDVGVVLEALKKRTRWAMELFDASPKYPVGALYGAFYQLGNFDQCISIKQPKDELSSPIQQPIKGKYCLTDISVLSVSNSGDRVARSSIDEKIPRGRFNNTLHWAICVPSSCQINDVKNFLEYVFQLITAHVRVTVDVTENQCYQAEETLSWTKLDVVFGCLLGIFLIFVFISTAYHFHHIQKRRKTVPYTLEGARENHTSDAVEVLFSFSVINNVQKMFSIHPNEFNLECVSGVKFLSMTMIIASHSLLFLIGGPVLNTDFYDKATMKIENGIFLNNPLMVDTFLLLSGFLMCRLLLVELEKRKGKINFLIVYVGRYLRLTPSYLVVLGLYCTYLIRTDSGPLWKSRMLVEQERCLASWWANILYINNYVNTDKLCMFQSWYLAVDTQLFIIAPAFIYPLWRWRRIGEWFLGAAAVFSVVIPFVVTFIYKLDPTFMAYAPEMSDISLNYYFSNVYIKTHMRANSYFIGLALGYLIHRLQTLGTKIPPKAVKLGWILAITCGVGSMFSIYIFFLPDHEYSAVESAIYASLHRAAWSFAIGWVLLACITDNAPLVNGCLSFKVFSPLSKLTYCAYLVNGIIELHSYGTVRDPLYMSIYNLAVQVLAHVVLTYTLAFIVCILFESPIHGLEKILLRRDKRQRERRVQDEA